MNFSSILEFVPTSTSHVTAAIHVLMLQHRSDKIVYLVERLEFIMTYKSNSPKISQCLRRLDGPGRTAGRAGPWGSAPMDVQLRFQRAVV